MELRELIELMITDNVFIKILNNPLAQFGPRARNYLGANLLPEKIVPVNIFKEEYIMYRSNIANAGTRYSPPQLKGNNLVGEMLVELAESDIASEFSSADYDALLRILERLEAVSQLAQVPPEALASLIRFVDATINIPLVEFNEYMRWQAICNASVLLQGDGGFSETVQYSNPPGHRVVLGSQWSNPNYDPYPDIVAGYRLLTQLGYQISAQYCGLDVLMILLGNPKILQRLGYTAIISGNVIGQPGMASIDTLNMRLAQDHMPPIQTYDLQYRMQIGTQYFFPRGTFVQVCTTGRDMDIDRGDGAPFILPDVLGYLAVGRPANRNYPGRAVVVEYNDKKGAPMKCQGWQTSLPVIFNPEALYVISGIS